MYPVRAETPTLRLDLPADMQLDVLNSMLIDVDFGLEDPPFMALQEVIFNPAPYVDDDPAAPITESTIKAQLLTPLPIPEPWSCSLGCEEPPLSSKIIVA